jgi:glutamine synthetase
MPEDNPAPTLTAEHLPELLKDDIAVKVAGIDVDGMLRGKLMAKKKFLSIAKEGFGFCSVIFGWDMHDQTYFKELAISNKENGYRDLIAVPDLSSFRRIPWEDNVPFFFISFYDPDTRASLSACPRSLLMRAVDKLKENGYGAMAGGEFVCPGGLEGRYYLCSLKLIVCFEQPSTNSTNSAHHKPTMEPRGTHPVPQHSCATTQ